MPSSVLFVCTGNIFRSMSAEYCLRDYLQNQRATGITVSSAGTQANPEPINPHVRQALARHGIDCSGHMQRRLTQAILDSADHVIAMSRDHVAFIKQYFNMDVPLFNKVALGEDTSVWDLPDRASDGHGHDTEQAYIHHVVNHIHDSIPELAKKIS